MAKVSILAVSALCLMLVFASTIHAAGFALPRLSRRLLQDEAADEAAMVGGPPMGAGVGDKMGIGTPAGRGVGIQGTGGSGGMGGGMGTGGGGTLGNGGPGSSLSGFNSAGSGVAGTGLGDIQRATTLGNKLPTGCVLDESGNMGITTCMDVQQAAGKRRLLHA